MRMLLVLFVCLAFVGCNESSTANEPESESEPEPCRVDGQPVISTILEYAETWDDALGIAQNASRIALSGPISDLQEVRRDFRAEEWPACAKPLTDPLTNYMDATIEALLMFMGNEDDNDVQMKMNESTRYFRQFERAVRNFPEN